MFYILPLSSHCRTPKNNDIVYTNILVPILLTMATANKLIVLTICMVMVSSFLPKQSEANYIGTPAMRQNQPYCPPGNPCITPPVNPPERGCNEETRCREGPPSKEKNFLGMHV